MKKQTGFSLLELIIVMAIIGILIAVAIPSYQTYTRRAHYTEIVESVVPYRIGIEECFQINADLNGCAAGKNGIPEDTLSTNESSLIQSITVDSNGKIIVVPKNKYGINNTDTYELIPQVNQEQLIWKTNGGGVKNGYAN